MKSIHDSTPNEMFSIIEKLVLEHDSGIMLRSLWFQSDNYHNSIKKDNQSSTVIFIKRNQEELQSFTIKNAVDIDDLKNQVNKILKNNFL